MNNCPVCGGDIIGDGYTLARYCENVELPADRECDAFPLSTGGSEDRCGRKYTGYSGDRCKKMPFLDEVKIITELIKR